MIMDIIVDFDGTCVKHSYPKTGDDIGAQKVLKRLVQKGHNLILFTMRSNFPYKGVDNKYSDFCTTGLDDAVSWFKVNDIPLYGIQTNPTQSIWTSSPKAYGQLFIDDIALGCPLIYPKKDRPYVDWIKVEKLLELQNIL